MSEVISIGQLTLTDLNDAIISGDEPKDPIEGALWVDEKSKPPMIKKWNGTKWVDVGELDPNLSVTIENITETLGTMANDNKIDFKERQIIKDKLTDIIGYVILDTATTLPTSATLDSSNKGGFWTVRKSATNAGIATTETAYKNVATRYTELKTYLDAMKPVKIWDVRNENKDKVIDVIKSTFRDKWLQYYLAVDTLATLTSQKIKENNDKVSEKVDEVGKDVNKIEGRVVKVESKVTDESIVNTLTSSEKWKQQVTTINSKASQSDIDKSISDLDIGGRNLALNSDEGWSANSYKIFDGKLSSNWEVGETYTVTVKGIVNEGQSFGVWRDLGSTSFRSRLTPNKDKTIWTYTNVVIDSTQANKDTFAVYNFPSATAENAEVEWIKIERGDKPTDWSPAPEDIDNDIALVGTRINEVEQIATPEGLSTIITETVFYEDLLESLSEKADVEDLGDFITQEELEDMDDDLKDRIAEAIGDIDFEPYATKLEVEETAKQITNKFSASGGMNLIKNSVGYAGTDFWDLATSGVQTVQNAELDSLGYGSGFYFPTGKSGDLRQFVSVIAGVPYTLSFDVKKDGTGTRSGLHVQIRHRDNSTILERIVLGDNVTTDGFETHSMVYTPDETGEIVVVVFAYANAEATVTGLMLNIGDIPLQWSLATGEVYNTNIRMDINGIRVSQMDEDRREIGYTQISPEEFAGYYDTDDSGYFEKVFYLNGEETVTKKLRAEEEITMGTIKVIKISSSKNQGWAFVPTVDMAKNEGGDEDDTNDGDDD